MKSNTIWMKGLMLFIAIVACAIAVQPASLYANDTNKAYHFGFKKSKDGKLPSISE